MRRPAPDELHAYYRTYTDLVPDGALFDVLARAPGELEELLARVPPDRETYAYAEGKWTIREVLGHVVDTERMFAFRGLQFARGDASPLPDVDQDVWAAGSNANDRPLADQLAELREIRSANVRLFRSFDDAILDRRGVASGRELTVRAIIYILAGHELHHRRVLQTRYAAALNA